MKKKVVKKIILKEEELTKIVGGSTKGFLAFNSKMNPSWFSFFKKKR